MHVPVHIKTSTSVLLLKDGTDFLGKNIHIYQFKDIYMRNN